LSSSEAKDLLFQRSLQNFVILSEAKDLLFQRSLQNFVILSEAKDLLFLTLPKLSGQREICWSQLLWRATQ
jgi:hypothetical protein